MNKGTFVSYQLAEAILLMNQYLKDNKSLEGFDAELDKLKQKWKNDILPSTGTKIPDLSGMQILTVKQLLKISEEIREYDTYSTENSGCMQHITRINRDGTFEFDFFALDSIVELARQNGKKIIIDSAIVHGDHFPEMFKNLSREEISNIIRSYIRELTTRYGDIIERIDVLNAIFERNEIKGIDGKSAEDFWIEKFGENYGKEIIDICKETLGDRNIPLCWNEFYITNQNCSDKKDRFLHTVSYIDHLDVIGIQDAFQDFADLDYILRVLKEIENICTLTNKKFSITELSCILGKKTVLELYDRLNTDPTKIRETIDEIESRINSIIENVVKYSLDSKYCFSIEGRISKELDYYSRRSELREFNERTGTLIGTVGNHWINIINQHSHDEELEEMFDNQSVHSETIEKSM